MNGTLWLAAPTRSRHQLTVHYGFDDLRFSTKYWYADVDLPALEARYGVETMTRVYFHIAAFEANKLCSLRPERFDVGPFARFATPAFVTLWQRVVREVWAQWRYEHDDPDYAGPRIDATAGDDVASPIVVRPGPVSALAFCGGGKDSLVALRLLERGGIPFDTLAYSSSIYGPAAPQHGLIDGLIDHTAVTDRRRLWMLDDFLDSPVLDLHPELGCKTLHAAETPASLFAALPLVLTHGYRWLVLAHERSADTGNLVWDRTGEPVNHQWGKSLEAEQLLSGYLRDALVADLDYFSLLKPLWDPMIFALLARDADCLGATHSCNVRKPWCKRCPKCAYVWLGCMAYLPVASVDAVFGENLFDVEANQIHFRRLLGLEAHTPFECVGTVEESRLAFALCQRKGLTGAAMDTFIREVATVDVAAAVTRFFEVDFTHGRLPDDVLVAVRSGMLEGAAAGRSLT